MSKMDNKGAVGTKHAQYCVYLIYVFKRNDVKDKTPKQIWEMLRDKVTIWKGFYVGIHAKHWTLPTYRTDHAKSQASAVYNFCVENDCIMYEAKTLLCDNQEEYKRLETFIWYYAESIIDENFEVINIKKPDGYLTHEEEKKAQGFAIDEHPLLRFEESGSNPDDLFELGYICTPEDIKLRPLQTK